MSTESKKDPNDRSARTRAIGSLLVRVAGETLGRRGFAEGTVFQQWRDIVGADIADACLPEKLGFPAGRRNNGTLHVLASGGAALELQHRSSQIIDRVNGYLGYGAVVHLRIRQGRLPARGRSYAVIEESIDDSVGNGEFEAPTLDRITEPKLKEALARFGRSIRRGEKRRARSGEPSKRP
jgi:hypothetical protein